MKLRTLLLAGIAGVFTLGLAAQAQVPGVNSTLNSVFTLAYDNSTMKQTFSATAAGITPVSSGNDFCTLSGSATKTLKVRRIIFGSSGATASTEPIAIVKRSTASTGAGTAITKVPYDSANSAATATLAEVWTANPTAGTLVGVIQDLPVTLVASSTAQNPTTFTFGALGQPIVLRGAAQSVSLSASGVTLTGTLSCTFEWTEE